MTPTQELIERLNKRAADCEDNARVCDLNDYDAEKALLEAEAADFRQAADRLASLSAELEPVKAENAKLREAVSHADRCERFVKLVAGQKLSEQAREWQEEEYGDDGDPDFEGAYDTFIEQARNIINERRAALGGAG